MGLFPLKFFVILKSLTSTGLASQRDVKHSEAAKTAFCPRNKPYSHDYDTLFTSESQNNIQGYSGSTWMEDCTSACKLPTKFQWTFGKQMTRFIPASKSWDEGKNRHAERQGPESGNGNTNRALQTLQCVTSDCRLYWDSGSGTTDGPDLFSQQPQQQTTLCGITTYTSSITALYVLLTPTRTNKLWEQLWKRGKKKVQNKYCRSRLDICLILY